MALTFLPVALLAALSPFFVRLLLKELEYGGRITGAVYGVSTMGNVLGTLVTVFVFIPSVGTSKITVVFGGVLIACGVASLAAESLRRGAGRVKSWLVSRSVGRRRPTRLVPRNPSRA